MDPHIEVEVYEACGSSHKRVDRLDTRRATIEHVATKNDFSGGTTKATMKRGTDGPSNGRKAA